MKRFVLLLSLLIPSSLLAQPYSSLLVAYPEALQTSVTGPSAFVYAEADLRSRFVGKFREGKAVLAYRRAGDFYAVATPEHGHAGYVLLTALDVPQVSGAATAPPLRTGYRSPAMARAMSLAVPGGGHLYAGAYGTGSALLLGSAASVITGYYLSARTMEGVCPEGEFCYLETDYDAFKKGISVAAAAWAFGIATSGRAAKRNNRRKGFAAQARLVPDVPSRRARLAVRVRW